MATAYTSILKLALPVQGELSGTWGDVVNDNITSMVEEAIAGRAVINTWTTNSHTLTSADGTTSESRCAMLEFTDTGTALTGAGEVICPAQPKIYIAKNASGQAITVKTSAGTGIAVQNGETKFVFCDGTNVVEAVTSMTTLKVGTGVQVSTILDEDNMASDSATALATQQSIKAYVDAQVTAQDLDFAGDTGTGAVDLDSQSLTVAGTANEVETSASGQTLTVGLPAAIIVTTSVTTPTVQTTNLNANDGTAAVTIADVTGQTTINDAVLTTADINGGTADNVVIGGTTAAAGSFTTVGATGNITSQGQVITDTINEQTATSGVTVDGVLLKDGGATLTGDLTVDTDTLYVDSTNNNVGIGESSPVNIANYVGLTFSDTTGGFIRFKNDAGTQGAQITGSGSNLSIETIPALPIIFYTNSTEAMRIDSSGNVLVGTTSGTNFVDKMRVVGDTNGVDFGGSSSTGVVRVRGSDTGAALIDFTKLSVNPNSSPFYNGRIFYSFNDHFMRFETNAQEAMRIDSSGNVGIGVTNPSDFNGGANNLVVGTGSGSQGISIYAGTSSNSSVFFVDGDSGTAEYRGQINYRHDVDAMSFHTAGGFERMRIDSSGNVGIGTNSPSYTFHTKSTSGGVGLIESTTSNSDLYLKDSGTTYNYSNGIGSVGDALRFRSGDGSERMRIDSSGNVGIGTSSPSAILHTRSTTPVLTADGSAFSSSSNGTGFGIYRSAAGRTAGYTWKIENAIRSGGASASDYQTDDLLFKARAGITDTTLTEHMRITSTGNVGIGTSSPSSPLTVVQSADNDLNGLNGIRVDAVGATNNRYLGLGIYDTQGVVLTAGSSDTSSSTISFRTAASGAEAERMRIDSSGRVGIGTSSPDTTTLLTVDGAMTLLGQNSGHGASRLKLGQDTTAISQIRFYGADNSTPGILQFTGSSADGTVGGERMRIDSSGNVGVGGTPTVLGGQNYVSVHSPGSSTNIAGYDLYVSGTREASLISYPNNSEALRIAGLTNRPVTFHANNAERMRIDGSGNVLVGKTSATTFGTEGIELRANDIIWATRTSAPSLELNRLASDGELAAFYKDSVKFGSIATNSAYLKINSGNASFGSGIEFHNLKALPVGANGASSNGTVDLGENTRRWKDLYLSGGVYLGGTGAANKLDDYEEGGFSPFTGIGSGYTGEVVENAQYTKIGRLVYINLRMKWTATDGSGNPAVFVMPFTHAAATNTGTTGAIMYSGTQLRSGAALIAHMATGQSNLYIYSGDGGTFSAITRADINGSYDFAISFSYYTA